MRDGQCVATLGECSGPGTWYIEPLLDSHVSRRRKEIFIPSL